MLVALAPAYLLHCQAHPNSLIRYLGCHSIRMPLNTRKVYFVVMVNVLPPQKCDLTFDLKGATSNRQRAKQHTDIQALRAGTPLRRELKKTLLDKDWMAMQIRLSLSHKAAETLAATIATDAAFLAQQGLLDYSLLVGVILKPQLGIEAERSASTDSMCPVAHVHRSVDGAAFYVGIIDILEKWGCGKWPVQSCVLQTVFRYACCMQWYNPRGITALPPSSYASRFEEFLAVHMLGLAHLSQSGQSSWQPFW